MSQRTFYVRLFHRHITRGGGRWVPAVGACDDTDGPPAPFATDVALYAVECSAKSEACDIVTHWLAKGRPDIMRVRAVWEASPMETMLQCLNAAATPVNPREDAARALHASDTQGFQGRVVPWDEMPEILRDNYRKMADAALNAYGAVAS